MNAKHTPGNWKTHGLSVLVDAGVIVHVAQAVNREADARLIAAAPDLLAACECVIDDIKCNPPDCGITQDCVAQIHAAITKAKGE